MRIHRELSTVARGEAFGEFRHVHLEEFAGSGLDGDSDEVPHEVYVLDRHFDGVFRGFDRKIGGFGAEEDVHVADLPGDRLLNARTKRRERRAEVEPRERFAVELPGDAVAAAHEAGDEARGRTAPDFFGGGGLMDDAALHHDDAVAEDHGFVLVVRHDDGGDAEFAQDDGEFFADLVADLGVQGRERFVEKKDLRADRKGAGDALALTAREGEDVARLVLLKVDETEHFVDGLFNLLLGFAPHRETVGDVLRNRHVREKGVLLEHEADAALFGGEIRDVFAAHEDLGAFVGRFKTRDDAKKRRLPTARGPEKNGAAARVEREREGLQDAGLAVVFRDVLKSDGNGIGHGTYSKKIGHSLGSRSAARRRASARRASHAGSACMSDKIGTRITRKRKV